MLINRSICKYVSWHTSR